MARLFMFLLVVGVVAVVIYMIRQRSRYRPPDPPKE
jgi:hypothetical protein